MQSFAQEKEAQLLLENGDNPPKPKKGRPKGKKKQEEKMGPSETAADGVKKMLDAKKLSSKVNYANLDSLFQDPEPEPSEWADKPSPPTSQSCVLNIRHAHNAVIVIVTGQGPSQEICRRLSTVVV